MVKSFEFFFLITLFGTQLGLWVNAPEHLPASTRSAENIEPAPLDYIPSAAPHGDLQDFSYHASGESSSKPPSGRGDLGSYTGDEMDSLEAHTIQIPSTIGTRKQTECPICLEEISPDGTSKAIPADASILRPEVNDLIHAAATEIECSNPSISDRPEGDDLLPTINPGRLIQLKCHHIYHEECITTWFKDHTHNLCPVCRNEELPESPTIAADRDLVIAVSEAVAQRALDFQRILSERNREIKILDIAAILGLVLTMIITIFIFLVMELFGFGN